MEQANAIRLENLGKTFGRGKKRITAVAGIDLEVTAGQVYGFLGPNGAGKTTTIRLILGLMHPTTGAAYVYNRDIRRDHSVLRRVGAVVEGATFYPYLTGRANLEILAHAGGHHDPARITALLKQVGLDGVKQRAGKYSLGMKQRLGLAAALLHDPNLLIFDEPTNGLDPAGIQEMRSYIRDLAHKHGKTVFLSSHILSEVEQTCDRVAIINRGEIVREGSVAALLAEKSGVRIRATPQERAAAILGEHWTVTSNGTDALTVEAAQAETPQIVRKLVENDIEVYEVSADKQTLEQLFLSVTGNGEPSAPAQPAPMQMEASNDDA
jgi:ABC-2 type transport system ATP-binding protein